MLGRLQRSADFETVLAVRPRSRSAHFAVHHVAARPGLSAAQARAQASRTVSTELSTGPVLFCPAPVDDLPAADPLAGWWLGSVVPKRHAKRAVTRNLIKRQIRAAFVRHATALPPGLWVVRLRTGFDRQAFPSAASDALRRLSGGELDQLLLQAAQPASGAQSPRRPAGARSS
jgi:ribonuclease P protein component